MLESYCKLKTKPTTITERKPKLALQVIWGNLPEGPIDKAVKNFSKRLKACVGAGGGHFEVRTFTVTIEFWHLIIS